MRWTKGLLPVMGLCLAVLGCGETLTLPATGTIYGELAYEDGRHASGLTVLVEGTDLKGVSDITGRFVINGVLAVDEEGMGKYYYVRGYGRREDASMGFLVARFKVKGQQSYSIGRVIVHPTGKISGLVDLVDSDDDSGSRIRLAGTSLEGISRADGTYVIEDVPVHDGYEVLCSHPGYLSVSLQSLPDSGEPIDVQPRGVTVLPPTSLVRIP